MPPDTSTGSVCAFANTLRPNSCCACAQAQISTCESHSHASETARKWEGNGGDGVQSDVATRAEPDSECFNVNLFPAHAGQIAAPLRLKSMGNRLTTSHSDPRFACTEIRAKVLNAASPCPWEMQLVTGTHTECGMCSLFTASDTVSVAGRGYDECREALLGAIRAHPPFRFEVENARDDVGTRYGSFMPKSFWQGVLDVEELRARPCHTRSRHA